MTQAKKEEAIRCGVINAEGNPCRAFALPNNPLGRCFFHSQNPINIVQAMLDPEIFGSAFPHPETWAAWIVVLKAVFGIEMDEDELAVFQLLTGRTKLRPEGYEEVFSIVGRRGGKSRVSALIAAWVALFSGAQNQLSSGERGWIFVIANDRAQGSVVFSYIRALIDLFPGLKEREGAEEIHLKNGVSIGVKTCSFRGTRGYSIICCIADEIAYWRDADTSANPATEVISSILPGMTPNARLIAISTPYSKFGLVYETWKDHFGKDASDILVVQASTRTMNSTYSEATIKRLVSRDPTRFRAEYDATFRDDISNFLPESLVRPAMVRQVMVPDLSKRYTAFLDPAGGSGMDSMTLGIAHREDEKIILDRIEEVRPPFSAEEVVLGFSKIIKSFGVSSAISDNYSGDIIAEQFRKQGIRIDKSSLSASDIYREALYLFTSGKVELLDNDRLCLQLLSLERRTGISGKDTITHPPEGHDDVANAACGALVFCAKETVWDAKTMDSKMPVKQHMSPEGRARDLRQALEDECTSGWGPGVCRIIRR